MMTYLDKAGRKARIAPGTAIALLLCTGVLGGCATSHIGSDWPCPVNQGTPCTSVSAADPAGASTAGAGTRQSAGARRSDAGIADVERRSLYRVRPDERLKDTELATGGGTARTGRCPQGCRPFAWFGRLFGRGPGASAGEVTVETGQSAIADSSGKETQSVAAAQRTAEVIGRIWIAPYVDDSGLYHEASWVRVVLEPARWRLP